MVDVIITYEDGEQEQVREIKDKLQEIYRKRFFFSYATYQRRRLRKTKNEK